MNSSTLHGGGIKPGADNETALAKKGLKQDTGATEKICKKLAE